MTTAVIIPTLDPDSAMIRRCLDSIGDGPEIIVEHDKNQDGFAKTCNRGAARTEAETLVFLNDDAICLPGWLQALQRPLEAPQSDAIVGARLVYTDGQIQHSGVFLRRDHQGRLEAYNRRIEAPSGEVPAVTAACLAIRAETFDQLDGFDEDYINGYEDVDLCLRARQAGIPSLYAADCTVIHLESQSDPKLRFGHVAHNIDLLQQRWGHLNI